ncbi:serine hydrolase domain-containing protein [Micromonospora sp. URMC 106]|uniref:serine hydrolase domain-containing protein n=1 Tax=Micromonospora sp. URMC 106 TaxID=3423408 RepID=UPI003F1994A0
MLSISAGVVAAGSVPADRGSVLAGSTVRSSSIDAGKLKSALDGVHRAGMPGVFAEVRHGGQVWRDASGVADVKTGRPVRPDMRHRVGSITKTFTAVAVMQEVEKGRIELDAPIGRYLPQLVPGQRGDRITVRMLLNHTSGFPEYLPYAFPSLQEFPSATAAKSLDDNRSRQFSPAELIKMGVEAPPAGEPGGPTGVYSNTNYLLLGELLEQVTGDTAEGYITRNVIERAGLRNTEFPTGMRVKGPHSRMYEGLFGVIDPPRDYSVYNMSWVGTGAALVSTVEDMNRFYRLLFSGKLVKPSSLAQMQRTNPVLGQDGYKTKDYGLGLLRVTIPDCGTFWGHDGTVWGAETMVLTSSDGKRQLSVAMNLVRWNKLDSSGKPQPHPIDDALSALYQRAMCG